MPHDPKLAQRVRDLLIEEEGYSEKKMFGGICYLIHGNMAAGVDQQRLMVRCGPEAHAAALKRKHARPMDITGKPMRGFVFVDLEGLKTKRQLAFWVELGRNFAASLPPK